MGNLFFLILTQPIYNALVFLYEMIPGQDLGVAIVVLTVLIKLILWPFTGKSLSSQKAMQELQPKVEEVKEQYKDDKEGQAKALMELYKEEKVNPFSSCLPMVIQLPVLLALYSVLRQSITNPEFISNLYAFVPAPEVINSTLFGFMDLHARSIPLAILAGAVQYVQARQLQVNRPPKELAKKPGAKDESMTAAMSKSMLYTMPLVTIVFGASLPGGVTLYWLTSSVVSVIQQFYVFRGMEKSKAKNN
ncbi:hypothetical protein COV06_04280 [Candidatus Uhrbacteria bacterium CG10_big_fil_rev_8_21_14_0_10_50_16]|uniref:Membrane insertase YidC/Oxa/ALB C-terminal domain-containing protein n=1 Tax=Candidatus Uhrbacteria bacterium CG10_big_fil_rev_8_21_14_0_10_50_16 TaxID=1975039 RepID=A0A2H0RL50_9BACT|nr:MAG: hypothetical protein COV06_04280 [Candidatus Uhrbacteria bacterium CG10_big_fil_rev_8_21_14_0_10_50_16]